LLTREPSRRRRPVSSRPATGLSGRTRSHRQCDRGWRRVRADCWV